MANSIKVVLWKSKLKDFELQARKNTGDSGLIAKTARMRWRFSAAKNMSNWMRLPASCSTLTFWLSRDNLNWITFIHKVYCILLCVTHCIVFSPRKYTVQEWSSVVVFCTVFFFFPNKFVVSLHGRLHVALCLARVQIVLRDHQRFWRLRLIDDSENRRAV
jgi:hypothetical protein